MNVFCGDVELSIIGPGDDWTNDPQVGSFAKLYEELAPRLGLPSAKVHGDGVDYWEVATRGVLILEWSQYLIPELCTERHTIYGQVPTQVILDYIEAHDGERDFHTFIELQESQ